MVKNDLKTTLFRGLVFPEIAPFSEKKKNQRQHRRNRAQKEVPFSTSTRKFIFLMLIGGSGSKSQYDSLNSRSEWMARELCHEKIWVLNLEIWVLKNGPKMVRKIVEKYFSQKCPKSISLDSGHLDKPFGPLIFILFPICLGIFWVICLTDVWANFLISPLKG